MERPNPDALLKEITREESDGYPAGKLKIFFGYAAGVGKTFTMLAAAHSAKRAGIEVVAGYIEPHTRPETLELLEGLEQLPPLTVAYKGISLHEFDLDGALARHPGLLLVDELAHSNAEGCRHRKRYQDIEELLKAGIDVYTTVNVQHLESLNDIVASITGVLVQERVPDSIFDQADQVELIDIEPDDLIARLNQGKIYRVAQAQRALSHFFIPENMIDLREIALRRTADRVNRRAERRQNPAAKSGRYTEEHILICLSSSPSNAKVIRTAARMVEAFHGTFTALFVETPDTRELKGDNRVRLRANLKLAEDLGATIATAYGSNIPEQIAEYAKVSGVSKIVIGRSNNKKHWFLPSVNLVEQLTVLAPNIDIYVIPDNQPPFAKKRGRSAVTFRFSPLDALKAFGVLAVCTLLSLWFEYLGFSEANIIMVYLLGVMLTALATPGRFYSAAFSILSVVVFNFFFTYPYFTLLAYDPGYPVTFVIMFAVSLLVSSLTMRIKTQAQLAARKAYRTQVLLETSQKLQLAETSDDIFQAAAVQMQKLLDRTILFYPLADSAETPSTLAQPLLFLAEGDENGAAYTALDEQGVAQWAYKNNKHAGATTNTLPGSKCLYLALRGHDRVFGVAGIAIEPGDEPDAYETNLMIAMLGECGLALEKTALAEAKREVEVKARQEQLRSNLLRAISHDLRTPLTSISGNAGILMENTGVLDEGKKHRLYTDIYDDSMWLINLVENLLSVTRIENGAMSIHAEAELLEDVFREALSHVNRKGSEHVISSALPDEFLMAEMDARLIIQVIINIVDNAIKYTPPGSRIALSAQKRDGMIQVEIADNGPGIPDEAKEKLFDMFFTADNVKGDGRRGLGLGLSLCKSIVSAHGGSIGVRNNSPKGTIFYFTLRAKEAGVYE